MRERTGRDYLKLAAFLLLVAGAAYLLIYTPTGAMFRTHEGRKALVGKLDVLVQAAGPLGPVLFIFIYALGVLLLPATPFAIAGAVIFGKFHGMLYNLAADVLGASISFYLGRYFLHGVARGFLETRMPWLDRKAAEDGFSVIFYLRIFWFPFIVLNYAAGATRIRFRDYFLGTVLGVLPAVFLFTYFVGAMKEVLATYRRPADLMTFDLLFPVLLLVFSFFLPTLIKRFRKGRELVP
ncbi:MAG: VTT domain-containing protein [Candidatus Deferrimicrobium sp.]|nr:VTT domain-containing protein [Candidatus Deferrimicrobium sp.]